MAKRIIWTKFALEDKLQIFTYWNNRNKSNIYSQSLNKQFKETTKLIITNPLLGKATENESIKYIIVRDFYLFFKVVNDDLVILQIWDTRRNPEKLIYKLK